MDFESIVSAIPPLRLEYAKDNDTVCGPFPPYLAPPILLGPMSIQKSLAEIGDRLNKARNDLRIVEEQLLFQMDVLEDAKTRALVAETPLADREFRVARDDHDRLVKQREEAQRDIAELQREQDRLLDRMLGSQTSSSTPV